jgi:hypothetical protein
MTKVCFWHINIAAYITNSYATFSLTVKIVLNMGGESKDRVSICLYTDFVYSRSFFKYVEFV